MKTGVIIANTGTPDAPTPEAVERYLRQFLTHERIRPMPALFWNIILERFILPSRKLASAEKYARIWTQQGSPLTVIQGNLAAGLQASLQGKGHDVEVLSAMSFGNPSLEQAVATLESRGCDRLVVMPLYPQYAYSNAGIVEDDVCLLKRDHVLARGADFIRDYWEHDAYVKTVVDSVLAKGFDPASGDFLVITYHSVPRADIEDGDTYDVTTRGTTDAIVRKLGLGPESYTMCYQSRFDKGRKWLDPFLGPTVDAAARDHANRRVFVVTPGFAVDCLETIYDIDIVLRERFRSMRESAGVDADADSFVYVGCLNDSSGHVSLCESVLLPHLA